MEIKQSAHNNANKNWDITNIIFFLGTPLAAIVLTTLHLIYLEWVWLTFAWALVYGAITEMSVTAGYHRMFSHLAYKAHPFLKMFYLIFGAGAFQGPAIKWATDHRRHHRKVDTDEDPYSISKGFWFAHIGWIFEKDDPKYAGKFEPDLAKDKALLLQHRYYTPIAIFMAFLFPAIVAGIFWGDWIGGFIYAGVVRMVVNHHCTFFINSACHRFGRQTYGDDNSAKDSLIMAFLTFGEGYHNFHHHFQADYRNGVRWFDWDPTKWAIQIFEKLGLAYDLKTYPSEVLLKARLRSQEKQIVKLLGKQIAPETSRLVALREKIEHSMQRWSQLKRTYQERRSAEIRGELKKAKAEFQNLLRQWGREIRIMRMQAQGMIA